MDILTLLHRLHPHAIPESWEQQAGGGYEVLFREEGGAAGQVTFDAQGAWLESRVFEPAEQLPQVVQVILQSILGEHFILFVQRVTERSGQAYFEVEAEGYESEVAERIQVTRDGLLLMRQPLNNQQALPPAN